MSSTNEPTKLSYEDLEMKCQNYKQQLERTLHLLHLEMKKKANLEMVYLCL